MKRASSLRNLEVPMPCSFSSRSSVSAELPILILRSKSYVQIEEMHPPYSSKYRSRWCCRHLFGGALHCLDDVLVTRAAAQIAGHPVADFLLRRIGRFFQQAIGAGDHARRAVAALQGVLLVECFLQSMQSGRLLQAFDGEHVRILALHREYRARLHPHSVNIDRARPAMRGLAADVRAGMGEPFAQGVNQQFARFDADADCLAVEFEAYLLFRHFSLLPIVV